jgi:hypothetical protein
MEIFGYAALGIGVLAYFWREPRAVLKISIPSATLWVAYFLSLGVWTAVATSMLALARLVCGAFLGDRLMRVLSLVILAMLVIASLIINPGWVAFLPIMAAIWKTGSLWLRDHLISFRVSIIGAEIALLVFGAMTGAHALMASSAIVIGVNLVTAIRLLRQHSGVGDLEERSA